MQAHTLATILEQGNVMAFHGNDGRMFLQVLCSDGSELVAEMDDTGGVVDLRVYREALDREGLEFDRVVVEAGLAP